MANSDFVTRDEQIAQRLRELENLRATLEAHLQPESGPHSMEIAVETGLRAVAWAEEALRDTR